MRARLIIALILASLATPAAAQESPIAPHNVEFADTTEFWDNWESDLVFLEDKTKPHTVRLLQRSYFAECYHYKVEWGDGSKPETKESHDDTGCVAGDWTIDLSHTYAKPGTYEIHWYFSAKELPETYKTLEVTFK